MLNIILIIFIYMVYSMCSIYINTLTILCLGRHTFPLSALIYRIKVRPLCLVFKRQPYYIVNTFSYISTQICLTQSE